MFTRNDARWLSDSTAALYSAQSIAELTDAGMSAVQRRFRLVASTCEELTYDQSRYTIHGLRTDATIPKDTAAYIHDNPAGPVVCSGRVRTIAHLRELTTFAQWQRTDHYNGIAKPVGYSDQLLTLATDSQRFFGLGIYRDTVFTGNECALMALLQPHLNAAWHRVKPRTDGSSSAAASRVHLTGDLQPRELTPRQRELFRAYFPGWLASVPALPDLLRRWLMQSLQSLRETLPPAPLHAFTIDSAHGRLLVRCFPDASGRVTLFMVETPHAPDFLALRAHGLSTRECEVLYWIAQGKRDAEIATILCTAPKTISKHVENILRKTHAETRAAAVNVARERLRL